MTDIQRLVIRVNGLQDYVIWDRLKGQPAVDQSGNRLVYGKEVSAEIVAGILNANA